MTTERKRFATGIESLDSHIANGLAAGDVHMIYGLPGTFKSRLCYHILHENGHRGEKGLYLTFEQPVDSLLDSLTGMGYEVDSTAAQIGFRDMSELRREQVDPGNWFRFVEESIKTEIDRTGANMVVIDSLTVLYDLVNMTVSRDDLFHFCTNLRSPERMVLLISEMDYGSQQPGRFGVESYIADSLIHLYNREFTNTRGELDSGRIIRIMKMRSSRHPTGELPFIDAPGSLAVMIQ